jgi:glycosyltransferase involved in cell wall biosynthesis
MRVLLLPRYYARGASSRYRFWQYVPLFERAGDTVVVKPLLDEGYISQLYAYNRRPLARVIRGYLRRMLDLRHLRGYDAVICEQELLPYLPGSIDVLFARAAARFIVDYDDNPHIKYAAFPLLERRIPQIMAAADTVVAGNSYLAAFAKSFTARVRVIPTMVDLAVYPTCATPRKTTLVRIVWIGTPVTANLLAPILPVLSRLQAEHPNLSLRFIGAGSSINCSTLKAEVCEWFEDTETELLSEGDIGIMPLPDTSFARYKCGLKLIQYMACFLPVVASPVGVNKDLVESGRNGFLATSLSEWYAALKTLILDGELRRSYGEYGRAKVSHNYTREIGFSMWQDILKPALPSHQSVPNNRRHESSRSEIHAVSSNLARTPDVVARPF